MDGVQLCGPSGAAQSPPCGPASRAALDAWRSSYHACVLAQARSAVLGRLAFAVVGAVAAAAPD